MPAESWSFMLDTVASRVRDPGMLMHARSLCMDLFTRLQWCLNAEGHYVTLTSILTVQPYTNIYSLADATGGANDPQGIVILKVTEQGRPLDRIQLSELRVIDPRWLRTTQGRLEGYAQLGHRMLLLWPRMTTQTSVVVTSTKLTTPVTQLAPQDPLDIPQEVTPKLELLLELLLLLRQKDLSAFQGLLALAYPERLKKN